MNINVDDQKKAEEVVQALNKVVYEQINSYFKGLGIEFTKSISETLIVQGSVADGTKVGKPDEFDNMIPLDLTEEVWEVTTSRSRRYCFIA